MATINEIKQQAAAVKNATQVGENTAYRVGGALDGLAEIAEQHDSKLSDLSERQQFVDNCLRQIYVTDADFNSYEKIIDKLNVYHLGIPNLSNMNYTYAAEEPWKGFKPRTYKFKDTNQNGNIYTSFLIHADPSGLNGDFCNARVWDANGNFIWNAKLAKGTWEISLPLGYEIEIFQNIAETEEAFFVRMKQNFFNESERVQKSYIDSKDAALSARQQFESTCLNQLYVTNSDFDSYTPISDGNLTESSKGIPTIGGGYNTSFTDNDFFMPRCYKFKDNSPIDPMGSNRYTSFLVNADPSGLNGDFCNARVWNNEGVLIWEAKLSKSYWQISLPYGYEIEIYGNIAQNGKDAPKYKTGFFNESERDNVENNLNPWAGKCIAFYGDSVTYIGQGTGTSNGHASSPYAADWGYNWQLYVAKYLGLKEFYSRGVGSAMYEYQDWVQYAHTETGYSGDRPYPFVSFDEAEEKEGFTKTHGYLAAWDRIKAQFPASIKDSIDAIFITDSNSALNHTSDDFQTPAFIKGATKDADWAADSVYNVFGGDYDITTFSGAICSMIMKLQVWMPNAQIIIGSQISGRGDENITEEPQPVRGANFTKLDEARRGMYCAEKTRKIAGMMSIPYVPVFESMSVNPLNRNGKISDIVHPFTKAGGFRVGKTIAQYLMNFTPSEPPV